MELQPVVAKQWRQNNEIKGTTHCTVGNYAKISVWKYKYASGGIKTAKEICMKKSLLGLLVLFALCIASCATAPKSAEVLDGKWILVGRYVDGVFQERIGDRDTSIYEFSIKEGTLRSALYGEENEVKEEFTYFILFDGNKIYGSLEKSRPKAITKNDRYFGQFDVSTPNVLIIHDIYEQHRKDIAEDEKYAEQLKMMILDFDSYIEMISSKVDYVYHRYSD